MSRNKIFTGVRNLQGQIYFRLTDQVSGLISICLKLLLFVEENVCQRDNFFFKFTLVDTEFTRVRIPGFQVSGPVGGALPRARLPCLLLSSCHNLTLDISIQ